MMSGLSRVAPGASPTPGGAAASAGLAETEYRAVRAAMWTRDAARLAWLLASHPEAVFHVDKDGNGLLAVALLHGCDPELIDILVDAGADPGAATARGDTALHLAFQRRQYEPTLIERMLTWVYEAPRQRMWRFCALPDACGRTACEWAIDQWTRRDPLWSRWAAQIAGWKRGMAQAAAVGDRAALQDLIAGAVPVSLRLDGGRTALSIASQRGDTETALMLIAEARRNGETVIDQRVGKSGKTILTVAVEAGQLETVHMLLDAGATVDLADEEGNTPLMVAARGGDARMVFQLLQAGAELRSANKKNETPLSIATWHCRAEVADTLLEWGGQGLLHVCGARGETPLEQAVGMIGPYSVEAQWRTIKVLLSRGAPIDGTRGPDDSPLQRAIDVGNFAIASRLVAWGASATPSMMEALQALERAIVAENVDGMAVPRARRDGGEARPYEASWNPEGTDINDVEEAQAWRETSVDAASAHGHAMRGLLGRLPAFENLARDALDFVTSRLRAARSDAGVRAEAVALRPLKKDKGKQKEVEPAQLDPDRTRRDGPGAGGSGSGGSRERSGESSGSETSARRPAS